MESAQQEEIVIVGGGICGLATALALYREGIRSIVLEKSKTLRTTGTGIIMQSNGWRALDLLGVASTLRSTATIFQSGTHILVPGGQSENLPLGYKGEERRCLRRIDLVKALANGLPRGTVQFGRHVKSIEVDSITLYPILHLLDGSVLKAKIVIGCDGVNSVIATILGLNSSKLSPSSVVRGYTYYQNGHEYGCQFLLLKNTTNLQLGIVPVDHTLIYWFVTRKWTSEDSTISRDAVLIKNSTVKLLEDFPQHAVEMIKNSKLESLHLAELRYRAPWDLLRIKKFRKGTVTIAGDALHAMVPFLGQGGSACLEDAVVLARCLAEKMQIKGTIRMKKEMVEEGLDQFLKQRKLRVFSLCLQTYLMETVFHSSSSLMKTLSTLLLIIFFRDPNMHSRYDCCQS